jgi:transcription elongation factor GreA
MAQYEKVILTKEGLEKLKKELQELKEKRRVAAERMREAFQPGDIEDNPEYETSKEEVTRLDSRIYDIEQLIERAEIIEEAHRSVVGPGSTVEVLWESGETEIFHLVGAVEADPANGYISVESPVGKALIGRQAGDTVEIPTPAGKHTIKVIRVS